MSGGPIRVLVALDGQAELSQHYAHVLADSARFQVAALAFNLVTLDEALKAVQAEVAVLDLGLLVPLLGERGEQGLLAYLGERPAMPVVVLLPTHLEMLRPALERRHALI